VNALLSIYPDFDWTIWKFNIIRNGLWNNEKHCNKGFFLEDFWKNYRGEFDTTFLSEIENALKISNLDEWYRVSLKDVSHAGAIGCVNNRGGLKKLLQDVYPNHNWQAEKFSDKQKKKSSQWWLYKTLQDILNEIEILEEFQLPAISFMQTGNLMTFDVYIPALNMVFEYQGIQHYYDHYMFGGVKSRVDRDKQRRLACSHLNITYLQVPYWWQRDKESLLAIIHQVRPDIVHHVLGSPFQYPKRQGSNEVNVIKYCA